VEILETEEGPALGGAILAAVACGEYASVEAAANAIVRVKESVFPDAELSKAYQEKYRVFQKLYPAIKNVL
jgi:Sugar (pentulose and hexulose) kinases